MVTDTYRNNGNQVKNEAELTKEETSEGGKLAKRWISEIKETQKRFEKWYERVEKIVARYRDDRETSKDSNGDEAVKDRKTNVYWSLVQTERSHLYMEPGRPFVTRRYDDRDPVARDASMLLQRALEYSHDDQDAHYAMRSCVSDYQLAARGITWVRYSPVFKLRTSEQKDYFNGDEVPNKADYPDGFEMGADEEGRFVRRKDQIKVAEYCETAHVQYKDFLHEMASDWQHVKWVSRRVPMTYDEIADRFGKEWAEKIPNKAFHAVSNANTADKSTSDDYKGLFTRADIWEIWDKVNRQVVWICTDVNDDVLGVEKDLYGLHDFFPCARPLYGTLTPGSLEPIPDYFILQDTFEELDRITMRLKLLHEACRVAGVYDGSAGAELKQLVSSVEENTLISVDNWGMYGETGGLKNIISFLPLQEIIQVIRELTLARRVLQQEIYEISGLADVTRGASDYRETAKAQEIKGDFATMRLRERQLLVAEHYREILQIKAEIICKHYSDDELMEISSARELFRKQNEQQSNAIAADYAPAGAPQQPMAAGQPGAAPVNNTPSPMDDVFDEERFKAAVGLLRENAQRRFRIKVDTETLGGARRNQRMQEKVGFLQAMGAFMQQAVTAAQEVPNSAPLMAKFLQFAVRGFDMGRQLEADIDQTLEKLITEGTGKPPEDENKGKAPEEIDLDKQKLMLEADRLKLEQQRLRIDMMNAQTQAQEKLGRLQVDAQSRERDAAAREAKTYHDARKDIENINTMRDNAAMNAQVTQRGQDLKLFVDQLKLQDADKGRAFEIQRELQGAQDRERDRALEAAKFEIETEQDAVEAEKERQVKALIAEMQAEAQADRAQQQGSDDNAG